MSKQNKYVAQDMERWQKDKKLLKWDIQRRWERHTQKLGPVPEKWQDPDYHQSLGWQMDYILRSVYLPGLDEMINSPSPLLKLLKK